MNKVHKFQSIIIIALSAIITLCIWAAYNRPITEPAWPASIKGMAFSPYQVNQDAISGTLPTLEQIDSDLALLSGQTHAIRTYTTEAVFNEIPALAQKHQLDVTIGAWISQNLMLNQDEITRAVALSELPNVTNILIGNEVLLRNELPLFKLIDYIDDAKARIKKPVSTAETWSIWMQYPELADHVDFIAVHILPYWEGIDIAVAISFTADRLTQLKQRFPDKPIVIAEVGWPSEGRTRNDAVASRANQATFLRRFLTLAEEENYNYFIMEAFDQPWKHKIEGAVGAYWGVYDVQRLSKFPQTGSIIKIPNWLHLASISIVFGALFAGLFALYSYNTTSTGKMIMGSIIFTLMSLVIWLINDYLTPYLSFTGIVTGIVLLILMLAIVMLLLCETHEWIEAYWCHHRRRPPPEIADNKDYLPKVSIHVPIYNEPPGMVIQTLNALANLNYPDFEVIIVDNNTKDKNIWEPVSLHCKKLGERFHFHHVDPLSGYKAGALNFALKHTSKNAKVIAIIDSDYTVEQNWLNELIPAFAAQNIAIVQAPQDYRDGNLNAFKSMCYAEYKGFFEIGMVTRNDRNAIIQHGTMTLVRKDILEEAGNWAQWCITEDTELGLRIFENGYEAGYTSKSYGRGLIPDTFLDFKKQRYRWAYGAVQIIKNHIKPLLVPGNSRLTLGQRYRFIAGWLPWFAQSINLVFSIVAIAWSVGMMYAPQTFEVPHEAFSIFPVLFFGFNLLKLFHLYRYKLKVSTGLTIAAAIASLSLSYTIGKAMIYGIFTNNQPFIRTPKLAKPHAISTAVKSSSEELLFFITFIIAIFSLMSLPRTNSPDFTLWLSLLTIQSIPYGAAFITSLISATQMPAWVFNSGASKKTHYNPETNER